jgi:hypothetical protein
MLERWFGRVLEDDRVHGVTFPLFATSSTAIGELTDDSVGLKCVPSTAKTQGQDDFAHLPQFWCLEVSAEKKTDGSHEIFYVEHIDEKIVNLLFAGTLCNHVLIAKVGCTRVCATCHSHFLHFHESFHRRFSRNIDYIVRHF